MEKLLKKIKVHFEKSRQILILLHCHPDGDTIASSLALATYFTRAGKKADCAVKGEIPPAFSFLPGVGQIKTDFLLGDYDLVVTVDCGDANRTGFPVRLEQVCRLRPLINIDHHLRNDLHKIATVNLVDEKASAAAEVIWKLFEFLDIEIDSRLATYILAGIYYDTGGFQHSNVSSKTLQIAAECLRAGGRIALVSQHINGSKSSAGLKLWGLALRRMERKENGLVTTYLTNQDMEENGATPEDAAGIVNLINTVPGAKVAILFLELPDGTIKASLRTESDSIDVSRLARLFSGGGHKKAAGFSLNGRIKETDKGWEIVP